MQKGENMGKVVKFLYVIIIFLSLILVAVNVEDIDCSKKFDCPNDMCLYPLRAKCYFSGKLGGFLRGKCGCA
ncbi:unnamed protein product [Lathyrus oleraceus]